MEFCDECGGVMLYNSTCTMLFCVNCSFSKKVGKYD